MKQQQHKKLLMIIESDTKTMFGTSTRSEAIAFVCQKCGEPLRVHTSLSSLDPAVLSDFATRSENAAEVLVQPVVAKDPNRMSESSGNGFLIIGESAPANKRPQSEQTLDHRDLKYRLQVTARLFDILSDQSEIRHPLCEECADFIIDQMDEKLRQSEEECKVFQEFEEKIRSSAQDQEKQAQEMAELTEQLQQLETEEKDLLQQLESLEAEESKVRQELDSQNAELAVIEEEENKYWQEYNRLKRRYFASEDELQSVTNQLRYTQNQLDKLKRCNVFNVTFHIWHCGHFGTINGFRLGRLPTVPVEWSEINAAWGQAALLLHCMSKKINLTFQRYKLVPYGNFSFLESLDDRSKQLPLYASGGFRFMWNSKFDSAMVAFLDCLQQFKEEVAKEDSSFCLPYKMDHKGKIEDVKSGNSYSIKIQFNSEEQWTKCLKYMLTNLKWSLAWVSSQVPGS